MMTTRRDIIKKGSGLVAIMASGRAPAFVKSMLGLRGSALSGGAKLPYDAEVQYIQSNGYQHIDTGVRGTLDTDIYVHAIATTRWNNAIPLGVGKDRGSPRIICYTYWTCSDFFSSNGSGGRAYVANGTTVGGHYEYFGNKNGRYVLFNGRKLCENNVAATQDFTTDSNIWLFQSPNQTVVGSLRIVSAQIKNGTRVVRDFAPVRFINSQGQMEGAMYDRVSKKLFCNGGTGNFGIGADATS